MDMDKNDMDVLMCCISEAGWTRRITEGSGDARGGESLGRGEVRERWQAMWEMKRERVRL